MFRKNWVSSPTNVPRQTDHASTSGRRSGRARTTGASRCLAGTRSTTDTRPLRHHGRRTISQRNRKGQPPRDLGWLLDHRFLRLTHVGRHSGRQYRTVLEVVGRDRSRSEFFVVSGFGPRADWLRNLDASGRATVTVGKRSFPAAHAGWAAPRLTRCSWTTSDATG
ncbi:MAG TPA: nitroreductase family deazaflavin-dependent oxidoreductase [Pseudonocardia sp.]|nr:nitroreductase family deazaflavin-dependent oxidoreductase [Pseudonocardia sp.]